MIAPVIAAGNFGSCQLTPSQQYWVYHCLSGIPLDKDNQAARKITQEESAIFSKPPQLSATRSTLIQYKRTSNIIEEGASA